MGFYVPIVPCVPLRVFPGTYITCGLRPHGVLAVSMCVLIGVCVLGASPLNQLIFQRWGRWGRWGRKNTHLFYVNEAPLSPSGQERHIYPCLPQVRCHSAERIGEGSAIAGPAFGFSGALIGLLMQIVEELGCGPLPGLALRR